MNKYITKEDLAKYRQSYLELQDKQEEKKLQTASLLDVCLNEKVKEDNTFQFSFELEECKIYNQYESNLCWLFSCINLIKNNMAHHLGMSPLDLELSTNYLNFYDKLEKANHIYQVIADLDSKVVSGGLSGVEDIYLSQFLKDPVRETGRIEYARALIQKYGVVPSNSMPDTYHSRHSQEFIKLYNKKVRGDIFKLIDAKQKKLDISKLIKKFCEENYILLCTLLGVPCTQFSFTYKSFKGTNKTIKNITPQEFFKKYCSIHLEDFVVVGNVPLPTKPYYVRYVKAYSGNVHGESEISFFNLPQERFTKLCLDQLFDGYPVPIACENKQYRNIDSTILDTRLFQYGRMLGVSELTKEQALDSYDCTLKHWMTIRGVHIENELPVRWKVEDIGGENVRSNGYYVMNHNFFEKCVYQALINKKYLTKQELEQLEQTPILFGYHEAI